MAKTLKILAGRDPVGEPSPFDWLAYPGPPTPVYQAAALPGEGGKAYHLLEGPGKIPLQNYFGADLTFRSPSRSLDDNPLFSFTLPNCRGLGNRVLGYS